MDIRKVDTLPVLDQAQYGALPEIPDGTVLALFNTPWQQAEPEFMSAALIQASIDAGKWVPVAAGMAFADDVLMRFPKFHFMAQAYWNGLHELWEAGDIEVVEFDGGQYAIPLPTLATKALRSGGSVMYEHEFIEDDQPTEPIAFTPPRGSMMSTVRRMLSRFGFATS